MSFMYRAPDGQPRFNTERGRFLRLTLVNGVRTALRSLRIELFFLAAPQRRGVSGTLARSPMRFAVAALSLSRWHQG
jgi:hypothetical protein